MLLQVALAGLLRCRIRAMIIRTYSNHRISRAASVELTYFTPTDYDLKYSTLQYLCTAQLVGVCTSQFAAMLRMAFLPFSGT